MRTVITLIALLMLVPGLFASAAAEDAHPCGDPYWHDGIGMDVQDCELWRDAVPVVAGFDGPGSQQVVGELVSASGNWFTCQVEGSSGGVPGTDYVNTWWAATMADNGEWGFVNQAYFAGGDNNEPDANLSMCSDASGEDETDDEPASPPTELPADNPEWSDCLWGDAPRDAIVATFNARDGNTYTLDCGGVTHIHQGHGFTEWTIDCINVVLNTYDKKEPSNTDPRNDLFKVSNLEVPRHYLNYLDAFVIVDRTSQRVVTAYVELKVVAVAPYSYEGDLWYACVPEAPYAQTVFSQ